MSIVIVDAREWQNMLDLKTGEKIQVENYSTEILRGVLQRHHYPGDVDQLSNRWVSETALDLIGQYHPQLVCLMYSRQYFISRFNPLSETERIRLLEEVFSEVEFMLAQSGYTPVIVGTGNLTEHIAELDLNGLDGLAISGNWSARYAGLHKPTPKDLAYLSTLPEIERIAARQELIDLFPGAECILERIPEYLLVAKEGFTFRTSGTPGRKIYRVPGISYQIPVATPLGNVETITGLRKLVRDNLKDHKIALIILEGIGEQDFRTPYSASKNSMGWYYYEPGENQLLTMSTGTQQVFAFPNGYNYLEENDNKEFPFSGYFKKIPAGTIAEDSGFRSIAVGNHSMHTHMVFGADICVECFARNLYNQGCMGVIHRTAEIQQENH
ncbi:MAG: hypothetical protein PHW04_04200 [Candidatus Wallbacteria bacterium]|nr:hypothetical protein [Candidatus Wallbacteria bacterium]